MTKPFRFGIQLTQPAPGRTWAETAQQLENDGWSSLVMPDHFEDQLAVAPALAAAAQATTTLRLGALVYGNARGRSPPEREDLQQSHQCCCPGSQPRES